jgi:NhaP-type Na+/H+ or K+/H+ antiporter
VFTVIALENGTLAHASEITVAVGFTIVLSVYLHGLSAKPLTDRYARWYRGHPRNSLPRMESVHAPAQRWRRTAVVPVAGRTDPVA